VYCNRVGFVTLWAVVAVLLNVAMVIGDEPKVNEGLVEFKSEEGQFSVRLPGKPEYEVVEVGDAKEKQHQFTVGAAQGAYVVSYQENPNLKGSSDKQLAAALESGRDRLKDVFRGKVLESKTVALDKKYPGLNFRITIPQANGEARCRFYMVGTRLYQILAIGMPEFANSAEATQVIESFKLL
jgi:hypothetical protein